MAKTDEMLEQKETKKPKKAKVQSLVSSIEENPIPTLNKIVSATEDALSQRRTVWSRHRKKYRRGLQYLQTITDGQPVYFTNKIYSTIENYKANITRFLPKMSASPVGMADQIASDYMTNFLEEELWRMQFKLKVKEVVHHASLATFGTFKTYYDFDRNQNVVDVIAPELMLIDPSAASLEDARFIGNVRYDVPVEAIYAEFGEIPQHGVDNELQQSLRDAEKDDYMYGSDGTDENRNLYTTDGDSSAALSLTSNFDVYELWVRDFEHNVWRVYIWAGETLLKNEESPYVHNLHPYDIWFDGEDYGADNCYYRGIGSVEPIEPIQDRRDSLDRKIMNHIALLSNRQKYISSQSGLTPESVDNTEGRTYRVNGDPTRAVYYDAPPQMPAEVYNYKDASDLDMQDASGIADVVSGRRPVGVTAGKAMQTLKDSAEVRLEDKSESLSLCIERVGNKILQNTLQFFDGQRLVRAVDGDKGDPFLVVADYPEELQAEPMPMVNPETGMPETDETGQYVIDESIEPQVTEELKARREEWKQQNGVGLVLSEISPDWDVRASVDSALPSSKQERANTATEMFRLGAIDREAVLDSLEFPGRFKILKRLATQVTGANAGDPNAEAGAGGGQDVASQILQVMAQTLQQAGMQPQVVQQLVAAIAQQLQGGAQQQGSGQPNPPGQFNKI